MIRQITYALPLSKGKVNLLCRCHPQRTSIWIPASTLDSHRDKETGCQEHWQEDYLAFKRITYNSTDKIFTVFISLKVMLKEKEKGREVPFLQHKIICLTSAFSFIWSSHHFVLQISLETKQFCLERFTQNYSQNCLVSLYF